MVYSGGLGSGLLGLGLGSGSGPGPAIGRHRLVHHGVREVYVQPRGHHCGWVRSSEWRVHACVRNANPYPNPDPDPNPNPNQVVLSILANKA